MGQDGKSCGDETSADAKLFLLGPTCAAEIGGRRIKIPRLGLVLAAFLLLDCPGMRVTREAAARFLWEELDKNRQAGNLRQLLLRLRALEASNALRLFEIDENEIALLDRGLLVDVSAFRALLPVSSEQGIKTICKSYSGDLLAGSNEGGERLANWLASKRAALRTAFFDVLVPYLESQATGPISDVAVVAAKRIVEMEPLREHGYSVLMRACAERGDRAGMRTVYENMERRLATDAGLEPSAAMQELRETLLAAPSRPARPASRRASSESGGNVSLVKPLIVTARVVLPRLAVMAQAQRTASPAERELLEELAYDLATRLAQARTFTVLAPPPVLDGASANASLAAKYILEVRAHQGAATPTASVRLLDVPACEVLWAATFDGAAVRADGAQMALWSVLRRIEEREVSAVAGSGEVSLSYRMTLEGQRQLRNIDLPSIRRARKLFKAALSGAPDHVPAIAGMARSHVMEWLVRAPYECSSLEAAEEFAKKAISISPDDHRGYHELGLVNTYFKRLDEGVEYLGRAKMLSPHDIGVRADLADALIFNGQSTDAIEMLAESLRLYGPSNDYVHWILAGAHFDCEDYRAALREIGRMGNAAPAFKVSAAAHTLLGETELASRVVKTSMELNPHFDLTSWLSIVPCRNRELVQRYTDSLRLAGFD